MRFRPALGALLLLAACAREPARPSFPHALLTASAPSPVPATNLIGGDGKALPFASFRGKWVWIYFGFNSCPDVCPTALGKLAEAYRQLKEPPDVQVLFVSVDPRRDPPAVLAKQAAYFHPAFKAATGDRSALDALTTAVGARYGYEPKPGGKAYEVTHSDLVFVVDPEGRAVATYLPGESAGLQADFAKLTQAAQPR